MKKLMLICCCLLTAGVVLADPNEKVLESFKSTFRSAEDVKWSDYENHYQVSFILSGVRSRLDYDVNGNILRSIRYYEPSMLPLHIFSKVKKDYPKKSMFGVTELMVSEELYYYIKLQDEKSWVTLRVDAVGNAEVTEKYRKK